MSAWFLRWAEPLLKVSIVPRGSAALGFAQYLPSENLLMSTEQMQDMICMALGGRAAEQIMLGKITTGMAHCLLLPMQGTHFVLETDATAASPLQVRLTHAAGLLDCCQDMPAARAQMLRWIESHIILTPAGAQNDLERITQMAYQQVAVYGMSKNIGLVSFPPRDDQFNKPYSNETAKVIDQEVRNIVDAAYERCLELLTSKKDLVEKLALTLLDKEVRAEFLKWT